MTWVEMIRIRNYGLPFYYLHFWISNNEGLDGVGMGGGGGGRRVCVGGGGGGLEFSNQ